MKEISLIIPLLQQMAIDLLFTLTSLKNKSATITIF